eukprot:336453_1
MTLLRAAVMMDIEYHSRLQILSQESSKENTKQWTKLKPFNITLPVGCPISISKNEFVVAPEKLHSNIYGLYKYKSNEDPKQGKWEKEGFIEYPLDVTKDHTLALDKENNVLYIQNRANYVMQFDLNTRTATAVKANKKYNVLNTYVFASAVFINGAFNVIGGSRSNFHMVWNNEIETFSSMGCNRYRFKEFETGFYGHTVVYIGKARQNKNILLLFGGVDAINGERLDTIFRFDGNDKKWNRLELTLPKKLAFIASVVTQNERYVILCGGEIGAETHTDAIYVYDIDKNELLQSRIKCPNARSKYGAAILSDYTPIEAQTLVSGYLRQCLKIKDFPLDIVWVIKLLINREYLHLLQSDRGTHWRIDIADIISNITPLQCNQ